MGAWPRGADRPPQVSARTAPSCKQHVPQNHAALGKRQAGNDESPEEGTCVSGTSTEADAEMQLGVKDIYWTRVGCPCKANLRVK